MASKKHTLHHVRTAMAAACDNILAIIENHPLKMMYFEAVKDKEIYVINIRPYKSHYGRQGRQRP